MEAAQGLSGGRGESESQLETSREKSIVSSSDLQSALVLPALPTDLLLQVTPGLLFCPGEGRVHRPLLTMAVFHDEVEIEDFQYHEDSETYFYPCPCGDNFSITKEDLENGEDVPTCPSCSLIIKVIYDKDQFVCGETVPAPSANKELVQC
ncbi:hypothetical protein H8959_006433 [Pygathrix nigripes]